MKSIESKPKYRVFYLTGAPASGKTTLVKELRAVVDSLYVFEYGKELTDFLRARGQERLHHEHLRELSSHIVTPADIKAVDDLLLKRVAAIRQEMNVIIDSHAVTKEDYGYRATPFRLEQISELAPTDIVCLFADAVTIRSRIQDDAQGRPQSSDFETEFHAFLQSAVAVTYGSHLGVPVYFLDSAKPRKQLVDWFLARLA